MVGDLSINFSFQDLRHVSVRTYYWEAAACDVFLGI